VTKRLALVSLVVLSIVLLGSTGSLVYGRWLRSRLLPAELGYLPPNVNVVLATGALGPVWDGVEFHFGRVLRDSRPKSSLRDLLEGLGDEFDVATKRDLSCRYGLDLRRGALLGWSLTIRSEDDVMDLAEWDSPFVALVPLADATEIKDCETTTASDTSSETRCPRIESSTNAAENALLVFLCTTWRRHQRDAGIPTDEQTLPCATAPDTALPSVSATRLYDLYGLVVAIPEPGLAFVSNSCDLLERGLAHGRANLAYARADDALFRAVREQLRHPLLEGPSFMLYVREIFADLTPPLTIALSADFTPDAVAGYLSLQTIGSNARLVDEVLTPPPPTLPWRTFVAEDAMGVLVVRDPAIPHYLDLADQQQELGSYLETFLGGILQPTYALNDIEQFVLANTGYDEGVPTFLLGLWGKEDELRELVLATQRRLRDERDREIASGVLTAYAEAHPEEPPSLEAALRADDLAAEAGWLERFGGDALEPTPLPAAAFGDSRYVEIYRGRELTYLEPEVTKADVTYRLAPLDAPEIEVLLQNRYRLVSTLIGNTLWVSTGADDLRALLDRSDDGADGFPSGAGYPGAKISAVAQTTALTGKLLLSGERRLVDLAKRTLLDFRYHDPIGVWIVPVDGAQSLRLRFEARGPTGGPRAKPAPGSQAPPADD
jgi:hypothetical protein